MSLHLHAAAFMRGVRAWCGRNAVPGMRIGGHGPRPVARVGVRRRRGAMPGMRIGRCGRQSGMGTVAAMPHVGHGQQRPRVHRRYRSTQALADRKRATDVAGARGVLGEDREGVLPGRLDDHVEGFGSGDAQLVHRQRVDVLAVDLDDRHLQARDADVEVGHRRTVDEAQADLFSGAEKSRPVAQRRGPVHQVGVGMRVDVGQVGRRHAYASPCLAIA